jgi:hypothetical protein
VLEPLIEFAIREAAAGRTSSPITPIDDEAVALAVEPSRWGPRDTRFFNPRSRVVVVSPVGRPVFEADVAAFLASRHGERRRASMGTFDPLPKRGEKLESRLEGWGWLYHVDGYGRRLVCGVPVKPGVYLAWDMPGYNRRDALDLATAFVDGYLGPEEPG